MISLIEARAVAKNYGGVAALKGVDFSVRAGEVHALVGENGAGKSTLVKILSGIVQPDAGSIAWCGVPIVLGTPADSMRLGIRTIHQELELALPISVAENVFLGAIPSRAGFVDRAALKARTQAVLDSLGAGFGPEARLAELRVADRQVVEIARAVVGSARVLFMDEPTAALPPVEAERLLARIRALKAQGIGVVYISHRLDEVLAIADRITVLRDGERVGEYARGELDRTTLISRIIGRELAALSLPKAEATDADALACEGLTVAGALEDVSFRVGRGEIVGFFGLLGAGQSAIAEALFGLTRGSFRAFRAPGLARLPASPRQAMAAGFGYVPADRKNEGLALGLPIALNLLLPVLGSVTAGGFIHRGRLRQRALDIVGLLDIRCRDVAQPVGDLSGGNQQKVALGKWIAAGSSVLLLDEPTRGVDVGAKAEIYTLLRRFADTGGTCLVFSSDAEEIRTVCDRAYALSRGRIVAELKGSELDAATLVQAAL